MSKYGGTERVIWYLGKELVKLGHTITYLVERGSHCDFAQVLYIDESKPISEQIPTDIDLIHFHFQPADINNIKVPYIVTFHGNRNHTDCFDLNTVFISKNHAERYGSSVFVHNGLDWSDYTKPDLTTTRTHFHFLGKGAWRVKNLSGAINIVNEIPKEKLVVIGGVRFNFNMGIRFTFSPKIKFMGMIGGEKKNQLLNSSKGLIFPVLWHEPFGLAIIESLFYGCPVFGTPYGSLPELVNQEVGFLSNEKNILKEAVEKHNSFSSKKCHDYALSEFNSRKMALAYLNQYDRVLSGHSLNQIQPKLLKIQEDKFLPWH